MKVMLHIFTGFTTLQSYDPRRQIASTINKPLSVVMYSTVVVIFSSTRKQTIRTSVP